MTTTCRPACPSSPYLALDRSRDIEYGIKGMGSHHHRSLPLKLSVSSHLLASIVSPNSFSQQEEPIKPSSDRACTFDGRLPSPVHSTKCIRISDEAAEDPHLSPGPKQWLLPLRPSRPCLRRAPVSRLPERAPSFPQQPQRRRRPRRPLCHLL